MSYLFSTISILIITISTFLLREFTFHFSTLDWDEVTYIMMGEGLRRGMVPFVDLWDIKPIGLYLIYAIANALLGYSMETVRYLTLLFTVSSSIVFYFYVQKTSKLLALSMAFFYQLGLFFLPSGLSGNTEIFFIFFELLGFYLLFFKNNNYYYQIFGTILLGFAFIIKYIIIFEIILLYIYFLFNKCKNPLNKKFIYNLLKLSFILLPFLLISIYYYISGYWEEYWNTILITSVKYHKDKSLIEKLNFLFNFIKSNSFLMPLFFLLLLYLKNYRYLKLSIIKNKLIRIGFLWFIGAAIGSTWTGYEYEHYLLTLIPGYLLILSGFLINIPMRIKNNKSFIFLFLIISFLGAYIKKLQMEEILNKLPDTPKLISEDLKKVPIKSLFIASGMHTPYVLLNIFPPIPYIQPYNYQSLEFSQRIFLNSSKIIETVKNSKVDAIQFCDKENDSFSKLLFSNIKNDYFFYKSYFPNCELFLRNDVFIDNNR